MVWPQVALRLFAAPLLLPLASELFWRSFLMRWFKAARFELVAPQHVGHRAILLSTFTFALTHTLWLGAIVAGLALAWLYRRTGKLWVAVIAHAVTQFALAVWVLVTGAWGFW
jgi:CAAX prenyl protease-like protein